MCLQLVSCIYGQKIVDYEITHPLDWWEACKERWAPGWAKRRWPVRYKRHQIKLTEIYPLIRVPKGQGHFRIAAPVVEKYEYTDEH